MATQIAQPVKAQVAADIKVTIIFVSADSPDIKERRIDTVSPPGETQFLIAGMELRALAQRARDARLNAPASVHAPTGAPVLEIVFPPSAPGTPPVTKGPVRIRSDPKNMPTDWQLEVAAEEMLGIAALLREGRLRDQIKVQRRK